jgi:DNA gyrase subunit B
VVVSDEGVMVATEYSADSLSVLEGLDAVRKRPGMYIGSTDSPGLQHCMWEIIDNAVDEALAGFCKNITVTLHADGSVQVDDDGRGVPTDVNARTGMSGVELVFTKLHAGGKFGGGSYGSSGGLHGVGASVVNALSERLDVTVRRDGRAHLASFQRGVPGVFDDAGKFTPSAGLRDGGATAEGAGTSVRYWADRQIFLATSKVDLERTYARARQTAFLVPGLSLTVVDLREAADSGDTGGGRREVFCFDGGMADFVTFLTSGAPLTDVLVIEGSGEYSETVPVLEDGVMVTREVGRTMTVEVAVRWDVSYDTTVKSFVNIVETPKGGTHIAGFERALNRAVNDALRAAKLLKVNDESVTKEDVQEGLTACVLVRIEEPQFEGQTKEILGTAAAQSIVYQTVLDGMRNHFTDRRRKDEVRRALLKVAEAARTRKAARLHRETLRKKSAVESSSLPAKLADCTSNDVERTELLVVEGDSAAGCFTGDTLVLLSDGTSAPLASLVARAAAGEVLWGWSADPSGRVREVELKEPRLTRTDAELVEVNVSGGRTWRCTPDHLFLTAAGDFVKAEDLAAGTELMSVARHPVRPTLVWHADVNEWMAVDGVERTASSSIHAPAPVRPRVMSVTHLEGREDVYDLTVDTFHTFALAGGVVVHNSTKGGRDSEFQAVLPIRGKILNTLRATERKMLDNRECADLINAMGAGSGRSFDVDSIRYGKLILVMDADVDGSHIRCLMLTLVYRYMLPLLEQGRVFSAVPPLHKVMFEDKKQPPAYTYSDGELGVLMQRFEREGRKVRDVQRYKGLGEMSAEQLAETTLDPDVRRLRQITLSDAAEAASLFDVLMGDDVTARREFIFSHSDLIDVADLDV